MAYCMTRRAPGSSESGDGGGPACCIGVLLVEAAAGCDVQVCAEVASRAHTRVTHRCHLGGLHDMLVLPMTKVLPADCPLVQLKSCGLGKCFTDKYRGADSDRVQYTTTERPYKTIFLLVEV